MSRKCWLLAERRAAGAPFEQLFSSFERAEVDAWAKDRRKAGVAAADQAVTSCPAFTSISVRQADVDQAIAALNPAA
jgi:hypothetical protein